MNPVFSEILRTSHAIWNLQSLTAQLISSLIWSVALACFFVFRWPKRRPGKIGMGGYAHGNEHVIAAKWIFAGVPVIIFLIRRGLRLLNKFKGNGAAWGYELISTGVILPAAQ